jgi:thioredoxin
VATLNASGDGFEKLVLDSPILFVDFWAEWCGPCKMFGPIFESASEKHPDIVFAKVDTESERELAGAAGITSIPTLMAFRDGILLFREAGALPAASLDQLIQSIKDLDMDEIKKEIVAENAKAEEGK